MAAFIKTPSFQTHLPKTHVTKINFITNVQSSLSLSNNKKKKNPIRISCSGGLIEPDGGKLIELIIPESKRDIKKKEAMGMPQIKLSRIDLEWVHVLSEGWASPLTGFMKESEFLQTLHFNSLRLGDGSIVNMSLPIVLDIDDSQKNRISGSNSVALIDSSDNPVAILNK